MWEIKLQLHATTYQTDILNEYKEIVGESVDYPKLLEKLTEAYKPQQTVDKLHNVIDVVGGCVCNLQLSFTADNGQLGYGLASDKITYNTDGTEKSHTQWYTVTIPVATETAAGIISASDRKAINSAYSDIVELKKKMTAVEESLKKLGQSIEDSKNNGSEESNCGGEQ